MNKIIFATLVATAFAQDQCASTKELRTAQKDDLYKIYFNVQENKAKIGAPKDGHYLTFPATMNNYSPLQQGTESEAQNFKIQPLVLDDENEFQIKSVNEDQILSWNQTSTPLHPENYGYFMWDNDAGIHTEYTRFTLDNKQSLRNQNDVPLGFWDSKSARKQTNDWTEMYPENRGGQPDTKFCFVKVQQCRVDEIEAELTEANALLILPNGKRNPRKKIYANETCEATCAENYRENSLEYTCGVDGKWNATKIDCKAKTEAENEITKKIVAKTKARENYLLPKKI